MEGRPVASYLKTGRKPHIISLLALGHVAAALGMGMVAGRVIGGGGIIFPRDFVFIGVAVGQLTLAATWAAYGPERLALRALPASATALIGGYGFGAGFWLTSGRPARELLPYLLIGAEWFLFAAAALLSIRWLAGRRIVHVSQTHAAERERLQFSLRQLLGLSAVWAFPLAAPGMLASSPADTGAFLLSCTTAFPLVMLVVAPLAQAALARSRPGRKMVVAAGVIVTFSILESAAFTLMLWRDMAPIAVSQMVLILWGVGSIAVLNGSMAAVVLSTMLALRVAGYRFAARGAITPEGAPDRALFAAGAA